MSMEHSDQGGPKQRGRKAVHWRRDPAIMDRMAKVEPRIHEKWTNVAIAAELGVDEGTVRNDRKRLEELWLERHGREQDEVRAEVLAELEDVKARALAAARFDEAAERAVLLGEEMIGADGQKHFVQRDVKGAAQFRGNKAAALTVARAAVVDKGKLLGVYVEKQDVTHDATVSFLDALRTFGKAGPGS